MAKKLGLLVLALLALVGLVWAAFFVYGRFFVGEAPDEFRLSTPSASATPSETVQEAPLNGSWTVSSGQGGYRVEEVLSGQDNTVAGRTDEVSGTLVVAEGMLIRAEVAVQLDAVETDSAARDNFFRGHLEVGEFPAATFLFTGSLDVSGLDTGAVSVEAPGQLTLHGVTGDVVAQVEAQRTADGVEVVGSIPVDYTDYGLSAPNLGFAVVEPDAVIEVRLLFIPAA